MPHGRGDCGFGGHNCPCKLDGGLYNPVFRESRACAEACGLRRFDAGVAQLAEHNVANVVVVGSNPITRSFSLLGELLNKLRRMDQTAHFDEFNRH